MFCNEVGLPPTPATPQMIAQYVAYLARRLKASSIKQYLNVVRLLHVEAGIPYEGNNWLVQSTIRGIERLHGNETLRKTPLLPEDLLLIHSQLDLACVKDAMFWAAALVMFHGTFRKSNLLPDSVSGFDRNKQFVRSDFEFSTDRIILKVRWSKTIQCKERFFNVTLFAIPGVLCPVRAVIYAFSLVSLPPLSPAFVSSKSGDPLTGGMFNKILKEVVSKSGIGGPDKCYSSHSFRRGSATWAMVCGVPGEVVKMFGDWKSAAYLSYVDSLPSSFVDKYRLECGRKMALLN